MLFWHKKQVEKPNETIQRELNEINVRLAKVERDVFTAISGQKDLTDKVLRKLKAQTTEEEEEDGWNGIPKAKNINTKISPFK